MPPLASAGGGAFMRTFADMLLRVAIDLGVADHGTGSSNAPTLPTDEATLFLITDGLQRGRAEFYADFPDAQFRRRTIDLTISSRAVEYQQRRADSSFNATSVTAGSVTTIGVPTYATVADGDTVVISGSDTTPSIDGEYAATVAGAGLISIPVATTAVGSQTCVVNVLGGGRNTNTYVLPADWMGPPQGKLVYSGGRGGSLILTSMERVRLAHAEQPNAKGRPTLAACEIESTPSLGEKSRWVLRVWPCPDLDYTVTLRGRWAPSEFDLQDAEPTGHCEAIVAYAVALLVSKGGIQTGVGAESAAAKREEWRIRVLREEDKVSPRTLGQSRIPSRVIAAPVPPIRATNPWNP